MWLDVLCDALAVERMGVAARAGVWWWEDPPWRAAREEGSGLWPAIVAVLRAADLRESWRPLQVLAAIRARVAPSSQLDDLFAETRAVLRDEREVDPRRGARDPVGAALQLVLLRPTPERFVTWTEDLVMPPAVWWTGATLSGLIRGFRDLDARFKGEPAAQRLLALRTWQLGDSGWVGWPGFADDVRPDWERKDGKILLQWGGEPWAERTERARGRWLAADLDRDDVRRAATALASRVAPQCVVQRVAVSGAEIDLTGSGRVALEPGKLVVAGEVSFALPFHAKLTTELEPTRFRGWLECAGIGEPLPEPPAPLVAEGGGLFTPRGGLSPSTAQVPGLRLVPEFVSAAEEQELLAQVDAAQWIEDMARRVQHYGWRYNYRARSVGTADRLGPLPTWAAALADRMAREGLVEEMPDQVIVNEYVGNQGVAKHVDCERCFRGPIVTISLCEAWEMTFHGPDKMKVGQTLERRSAAVMRGEARHAWAHEIRKRKNESWGPRGRRVSLTFRKVDATPS
ncbi:MAG: alpha-ketoglutarate-dependent dioxygenase AlkB [Myxococcota bacterium]